MEQYILKSAVLAEIERRIELFTNKKNQEGASQIDKLSLSGRIAGLQELKVFLDTLEVKEVDLDFTKEVDVWISDNGDTNGFFNVQKLAKHFFELGLKAQQNINIDITNIDKVIEENGVDPNSKEAKIFKESYYIALEKLKYRKENKL